MTLCLVKLEKLKKFKINVKYDPDNIPEISIHLVTIKVDAKTRKLRVIWD